MKSKNTVRESFRDIFASRFLRLQTFFTVKVVVGPKPIVGSGYEALIELPGSISKFEASGESRLDRLVGKALSSLGTSAAIFNTDETGGVSGAVPSN